MRLLVEFLPVLLWCVLWAAGGVLLAAALFHLRRSEIAMVGLGMGLILETWAANLLAHAMPTDVAFWLATFFVFGAGITSALLSRRGLRIEVSWRQWCLLGALTLLFTLIGRGLAIFDDYQNLPTISLMAAGDVPPHFALNPSLNFGYHYFLLLFAAQLMKLGHMFPWTALDVARGLIMALPLMLAALWARRMTRSHLAGVLAGAMLAFAGGSRWILLLLPPAWLARISENITLIGSASTSAPSLAQAMLTNWKIDGAGPIAFPFAFYTGINQPYIMGYTGISGSGVLILLVLLLASNRSRHWASLLILCALLAALALANEIAFLLLVLALPDPGIWLIQNRSWRLPDQLAAWLGLLAVSTLIAAFQGGLLTEIIRSHLWPAGGQNTYFDTSLAIVWPPAIVSAHLGSLSIANLSQLIAALAEIGPIILLTPLLLAWARRCFRVGRWYEASLIAASAGSLIALLHRLQRSFVYGDTSVDGGLVLRMHSVFCTAVVDMGSAAKRPLAGSGRGRRAYRYVVGLGALRHSASGNSEARPDQLCHIAGREDVAGVLE